MLLAWKVDSSAVNTEVPITSNSIPIKTNKIVTSENDLLDSINDYLLEELGITLPDINSDLSDRIFCIKSSELVDRLDPRFNRYFEIFFFLL